MAADPELVQRARTLRAAGLSIEQIATRLDLRSRTMVYRWVRDLPTPQWTVRPNAKDHLRERAREMRKGGASYGEIKAALDVSSSSVSLWVRDLPVPPGLRERAAHAHRINGARWMRERNRREAERAEVKREAAARVGALNDRELMLLGAALYWAEGAKDKPWARREKVALINSDASVLHLFLRWLDLMDVSEQRRCYRLSIHETADLEAAHAYWSDVLGVPRDQFDRPTIKRHQPKTVRHNTGIDYHGCLIVSVRQSRVLYQQIDGLWRGMVAGVTPRGGNPDPTRDAAH
jgi:transposase-like protein